MSFQANYTYKELPVAYFVQLSLHTTYFVVKDSMSVMNNTEWEIIFTFAKQHYDTDDGKRRLRFKYNTF